MPERGKFHYQCWEADNPLPDPCLYKDRGADRFCAGCARQGYVMSDAVRATQHSWAKRWGQPEE